ncbi:MAG: glycoside hydrolase [Clostridia bacterium]|nr:glycoside hydrolase [Clostridia bacterium]
MRQIKADINAKKGRLNRYFSRCIGAGRAAEVMRHTAYEQLKLIQEECPFEYIRFHGLFHDEMGIVHRNDDGSLFFNFQYVDMLFDSLLDVGIRPLVELGLMPGELRSGDDTVFWWKMYKTPPKDYGEWEQLIDALVRHVTERYGEEEIKKWYFEVWNEPDHPSFFRSDDRMNDYFKIYASAAKAVKKVNPEYKVGGPATAGLRWIPEIIAYCRENDVPLDFISGHYYCLKGDFDPDGKVRLVMNDHAYLSGTINKVGKETHAEGYPLLITEWSASYSSRDPVHDSYFSAPFILRIIKECEGQADMLSYWVYTDVFEEVGVGKTPFHGGFGLFNLQSLKKPAYHAYAMLNSLGDDELACDDKNAYVCRKENEVQVLFWNSVILKQDAPNVEFFTRPLPAKEIEDARVTLSGFEAGKAYEVKVETVGYKMGDVYNAYLDMGLTDTPTREQTHALAEASKPKQTSFSVKANADGVLELTLPQSENQADLVKIKL